MKKRKMFPLDFAAVTTFAVVFLFAAICLGQDARQADTRADTVPSPAIAQRTDAQASAAATVTAEIGASDTAQAPVRRASARASDRRNATQAGKNRRNPAVADSERGAAPAKGDGAPESAANTTQLLPAVPPGDTATGGEMNVPPALAADITAAAPAGNDGQAGSAHAGVSKAPEVPQVEHAETAPTGSEFSLLKAAGGFGLVLSLIALGYLGARKYFPQYFMRQASERNLKLIETLTIGEKRSVAVIEFDSQRFIIGNTPNQITLLATLPGKVAPAEAPRPANTPSFQLSKAKVTSDTFRSLYEVEKTNGMGNRKPIPPDIRAKMRQLRESLET